MIEIERLCFSYQRRFPIFLELDWNVAQGERLSVVGPSGCGKTTLLYLLAGLRFPTSGKISIMGTRPNGPRISIGLILQDYGLLPWATAFDNISLGARIRGLSSSRITRITNEWLNRLGIEAVSKRYPGELSGGQRQRVAIARTLALEPDLLLMDEPFASLDTLTREELQSLIMSLWEETPITTILVTHSIEEAVFLGEKIIVLKQPPNTSPAIIENPGSGCSEYRKTSAFADRCRQVRQLLEQSVEGQVCPGVGHE